MRCVFGIVVAVGSCAFAGPEWPEAGDAGPLPFSAQTVVGAGPLSRISGELQGPAGLPDRGVGDYQDMYLINIVDPFNFTASTVVLDDGFATFDSQLWLFNLDGSGLLANQDAGVGEQAARLTNLSNDGSGAELVAPGLYYLAISGAGSVPLGGGGPDPMFQFTLGPGEISGPDGPGGFGNPITDWTNPGQFGLYRIGLTGAEFIVPAPEGLLALSGLGLLIRRRRV